MNNPIMKELRSIRDENAKKFNYDVKALGKYYQGTHEANILLLKEIRNNFNKVIALNHFSLSQKNDK